MVVLGISGNEIELINPITAIIPNGSTISVVFGGQDIVVHGTIWDEKFLVAGYPMLDEAPGAVTSVINDPRHAALIVTLTP